MSKLLLDCGGVSLGWLEVTLIALECVVVFAIEIFKLGSHWVFAFNFGVLCGIVIGEIDRV